MVIFHSKLLTFTRGECHHQARNINQINQAFSSWQLGVQFIFRFQLGPINLPSPMVKLGMGVSEDLKKTWPILDTLGNMDFF
jgi:hypothetical protein